MLQSPHGFHRVKLVDKIYINLPPKCRFLVALMILMQRKDWFHCSRYVRHVSLMCLMCHVAICQTGIFRSLQGRSTHGKLRIAALPHMKWLRLTQIAFVPSEHGNLHCCFHLTFHASSRLLFAFFPFLLFLFHLRVLHVKCNIWRLASLSGWELRTSSVMHIYDSIM